MSGPPKNAIQHSATQLAAENQSNELLVPRWYHSRTINALNWNRSFPYQLLLLRKTKQGYKRDEQWVFTLPIPPQALQIDMPFPVTGEATLGGYIEQWGNFAPRPIQFSGTTGVLPLRGEAPALRQASLAETIFAGTLSQARGAARAIDSLKQDLSPNRTPSNLIKESEIDGSGAVGRTSGYFQFRLLERWLERYARLKATDDGKDARLAFAIWKDEAVYLVTPQNFSLRRAVPDVFEYQYSFQGRAFRRVSLDKVPPPEERLSPIVRNPDKLSRALKAIEDARRVLYRARQTLFAIAGDLADLVLKPLREIALFIKDTIGTIVAMGDMPREILRSAKQAVLELASVRAAGEGLGAAFDQSTSETATEWDELRVLGAALSKGETGAGDIGTRSTALDADPANRIFENPDDHYEFFAGIRPGDLNLSPGSVDAMVRERERVQGLSRSDFQAARDQVRSVAEFYADAVGMGDDTYNRVYGRASGTQVREATDGDLDVLFALNDVGIHLDALAASGDTDRFAVSSLEYIAGLASGSGIAFQVPRSKFAVPFPYGGTLERLAQRHLGDPDRWLEIATLNGLRQPYIDEEGFAVSFLVNGSGKQIMVADTKNLRAGQPVSVFSKTKTRLACKITRIEEVSPTMAVVYVDKDVSLYKASDGAAIHGFLPDTVNSRRVIYIPSSIEPAESDYQTKGVPGVDELDPLIRVAGMDLLLTPTGDLVMTPDGDTPVAVGLTNIVQQVRIALGVTRGSLLHHPEFGLDVPIGTNTADLDPEELSNAARDMFADDPTFAGVESVAVQKVGPVATLAVNVAIAGYDKLIPVSVDVGG